jgi:hypothetical protein
LRATSEPKREPQAQLETDSKLRAGPERRQADNADSVGRGPDVKPNVLDILGRAVL